MRDTVDGHADRFEMQDVLFSELSRMFGQEVPMYDRSLAVNAACNRAVCDLLEEMYEGFEVSDSQLEKTSGERHGAVRIGTPDEFRWIGRLFACFGMEPHNFYDMTSVGAKSQPVIATAFRSVVHPGHRVFTSLLRADSFDPETRRRIEALLASREVFSENAKALIEKAEREGGLGWEDADALIREATERIFKWTGEARDYGLYAHLCGSGLKIAADIACFRAHHLNHLTPNTLCMDLYTSSMKYCMGEIDAGAFRRRAARALGRLERDADRHWMRLHFMHFSRRAIDDFSARAPGADAIDRRVDRLVGWFAEPSYDLREMDHAGFKDFTEGPSAGTPVLLRQDSYKALTERVRFTDPDGATVETSHTARFGEIEQRFYATTPEGRALYDECLEKAEALKSEDPGLMRRDFEAYEARHAACFAPIPKRLDTLLERGLVYGLYEPTEKGLASSGAIETADIHDLVREGYAACEGLRYEDFLPVSAAGIFASNLDEYGTASTAPEKPTYTRGMLEEILGRPIVEADVVYRGLQSSSILSTCEALGILERLDGGTRSALEGDRDALPRGASERFDERSVTAARA